MTRWVLSDGTVFEKGKVTGTSKVANQLRSDLDYLRQGGEVVVTCGPEPMATALRLRSKFLVYCWLMDKTQRRLWCTPPEERVTIVEPVEPPPTPKRFQWEEPDDLPDGMLWVY